VQNGRAVKQVAEVVINRCNEDQTYEARLAAGMLPG
jgi:hypothetical protein